MCSVCSDSIVWISTRLLNPVLLDSTGFLKMKKLVDSSSHEKPSRVLDSTGFLIHLFPGKFLGKTDEFQGFPGNFPGKTQDFRLLPGKP